MSLKLVTKKSDFCCLTKTKLGKIKPGFLSERRGSLSARSAGRRVGAACLRVVENC
jgi:hypothetical protein